MLIQKLKDIAAKWGVPYLTLVIGLCGITVEQAMTLWKSNHKIAAILNPLFLGIPNLWVRFRVGGTVDQELARNIARDTARDVADEAASIAIAKAENNLQSAISEAKDEMAKMNVHLEDVKKELLAQGDGTVVIPPAGKKDHKIKVRPQSADQHDEHTVVQEEAKQ